MSVTLIKTVRSTSSSTSTYSQPELPRIQIIVYQPQYQTQVVELILRIQPEEFGLPITLNHQLDLLDISRFYQQGNGNFWTAINVDIEKVIGTIAAIDTGNGQLALKKMFVDAKYRGRVIGAASQLINSLLIWAKNKNIQEIYLGTVDKLKSAHRFYEKNGFLEINKSDLPATFPLMRGDNKFYQLSLK